MNETFVTQFNIEDLFSKAERMEAHEFHRADDFFNELNLYTNV